MSYSKEEKENILGILHASGLSAREVCRRHPEFPHCKTLSKWVRAEHAGELSAVSIEVRGRCEDHKLNQRYPTATKKEAVRLVRGGHTFIQAAKRLGILNASCIRVWVKNAASPEFIGYSSDSVHTRALARIKRGERIPDIAADLDVCDSTVYRWARRAGIKPRAKRKQISKDNIKHMDSSKKSGKKTGDTWAEAWGSLPDDPDERARLAEVRLAEALAVLDVLKAPGPSSLTNAEKHQAGQAARAMTTKAGLNDVLADFSISKSTYLSQGMLASKPDKYAALRVRVRTEFKEGKKRFGSESIWAVLRCKEGVPIRAIDLSLGDTEAPVIVSEKVIRRIIREEGLVPVQLASKNRTYSSYAGEPDERPKNIPLTENGTHEFHSDAPGKLIVSDVTEFKLSSCKVYFSPAIDCFDGDVVAYTVSKHPDDKLTCSMLEQVVGTVEDTRKMTLHTDGGGNYRSNRWKDTCKRAGIVRSMSRKGKSPDNARAEGFFGILKQEFFYAQDWTGVTYERFVAELDCYITWYRESRLKKSLGWKTIAEHQAALKAA